MKYLMRSFRELKDMVYNSQNNFVELSDGQFIAITAQLRRKPDDKRQGVR